MYRSRTVDDLKITSSTDCLQQAVDMSVGAWSTTHGPACSVYTACLCIVEFDHHCSVAELIKIKAEQLSRNEITNMVVVVAFIG